MFNKILIGTSGLFALALGTLGFKVQQDAKEIKELKKNIENSLASAEKVETMIGIQQQLEAARLEKLKVTDNAAVGSKTLTSTKTTVIPGKVVPQTTTTKSTSTKSSKSTKTS